MNDAVYITRDKWSNFAVIWKAKIGIVKRVTYETIGVTFWSGGVLKSGAFGCLKGHIAELTKKDCIAKYGGYLREGTAYLVEKKRYGFLWTRVDQDLYLLDENFKIAEE